MTPSQTNESSSPPASPSSPRRTIRFFDPHFHFWDVSPAPEPEGDDDATTVSGHDGRLLFAPNGRNLYGRIEYENEVTAPCSAPVGSNNNNNNKIVVVHEGGVCIEANSVGFVDTPGSELTSKYRRELDWTLAQWETQTQTEPETKASNASDTPTTTSPTETNKTYRFVACASLESPSLGSWLDELCARRDGAICGVRQILNRRPSWPRNEALGDLLSDEKWKRGFESLSRRGLVFDLQVNPSQFRSAAAVIRGTPLARVVIDHAGTPTPEDLSEGTKYWDGLEALAECEGVVGIKLSMLSYADSSGSDGDNENQNQNQNRHRWDTNPLVVEAFHRIVRLFGVRRVAVASNAPVDGHSSSSSNSETEMEMDSSAWPVSRVLAAFDAMTASEYTEEERSWLFAESAKAMYGLRSY